ncbi:MAG: bifunctional (p)ppGpp synthetase/guanosine-3',5'-bis(diphosphate) 3'-pyrophosphohydrolase [Xanthomonadaceae bacterium]|nr:bifunctional (p)ppGpp synthetase/guanosine-3',5'-bis(diphosphate) 3'-pyrophosphohydrolase [Xanthomonadaceae bacterium]
MARHNSPSLTRIIDGLAVSARHSSVMAQLQCQVEAESSRRELAKRMLKALAALSPDSATVASALAIARPDDAPQPDLPGDVARLVEQFKRVVGFDERYLSESSRRAEGLRRLILALIADVRVVFIVLAWQLARMQLARDDASRRSLAREARAIHAPLANRLGIWQLKWQLEDLTLRYLEPEQYARIERLVAEQRADRERRINLFTETLGGILDQAGIAHDISGRAKHIYSIWRKMQRKGLDFHQLFDVRAVRVLVDDIAGCYAVLGLVHNHWQPVPGEFDDYISNPKPNLYRSLHTAVRVPSGRVFEVQIRTREMHEHAELGVAAHWRYKEGGPRDSALEQRIGAMRQLIEAGDEDHDDESLIEHFESLTSEDRVYALTPRGDVIDLTPGSTALDFAYHVHTEVGHRCRGAKVNGRIVPLNHPLANGDRVEILTASQPRPSRDWLNPQLGYLKSARARGKVRHYFRLLNFDQNLAAGRASVETELKRMGLDKADLATVAEHYQFRSVDDLLAAVGVGDLTRPGHAEQPADLLPMRNKRDGAQASRESNEVWIDGIGNLMYQLARCCRPLPGDPIAGFVTHARGVSIHREDCHQYLRLAERQPERRIQVDWSRNTQTRYPARILIEAWDRRELIKDIGAILANQGLSVRTMKAERGAQPEAVEIELTVDVQGLDQLSTLLGRLLTVANVNRVRRVG